MSNAYWPRIIVCSGEPAGIGPELVLRLASQRLATHLACTADPYLLESLRDSLKLDVTVRSLPADAEIPRHQAGILNVIPCQLSSAVRFGNLDPANSPYVLACLDAAISACRSGQADAMVTAPLQKSVINDAGIPFTGHTEYLAERCKSDTSPIMMLASEALRIALVTTHLSLAEVPKKISREAVAHTIVTLEKTLREDFLIPKPRIAVCGLNPHAGENGHFGREEIDAISPAIAEAQSQGIEVSGPLPADTAFTPENRGRYDGFISMFHDQGLPVIKALAFGEIVNVTLGLPIIRTSVDHGTALDIAGQGIANPASLLAAVQMAITIASGRKQ